MAGSTSDAIAQPRSHVLWVAIVAALAASPSAREALFAFLRRLRNAILLRLPRLLKPAVRKDFLGSGPTIPAARPAISNYASKPQQWQNAQNAEPEAALNIVADFGHGSFSEYAHVLPQWLAEGLRRGGFQGLKPIQKKILPLALSGRDVVGVAPTGSGKTLAFLVPGLVHAAGQPPLRNATDGPIILVLAPTRELAVQIGKVAEGLMKPSWDVEGGKRQGLNSAVLYGGARRTDQLETLRFQRTTHLVVATPGRLLDFLEHGAFTLSRVSFFVLDEGDRMLDFGFEPDVTAIARQIRKDRQMLYFSATWPAEVEAAALSLSRGQPFEKVFAKPVEAGDTDEDKKPSERLTLAGHEGVSLPPREIRQIVEVVNASSSDYFADTMEAKVPLLMKHLEDALGGIGETPGKALIFVSTRLAAEELGTMVARHFGLGRCGIMHGARKQEQREATLQAFRTGRIRALVATDVVGRGVDIPQVSHVVIYDMPGDIETYVHRVGRTGRNGQPGTSIAFFEPRPWNSEMAGELVSMMRLCEQVVPPELEKEARRYLPNGAWLDDYSSTKEDGAKWLVDESQLWRTAPELDASSAGLATADELGEWHADGARVWAYSANGGQTEQGRFELRTGGKLRTTWGWGEWSLLPSAPHCPRPTRACPTNGPTEAVEGSTSPETKVVAAPSEEVQKSSTPPKVARHLALSWGGVTDVVSLDASGLGFELVSRSGRPASTYKKTTIGKCMPGVSL